jgi:hypothetical protein
MEPFPKVPTLYEVLFTSFELCIVYSRKTLARNGAFCFLFQYDRLNWKGIKNTLRRVFG